MTSTAIAPTSLALAQQEVERRAVEGLGVLVQPGVRQMLEDHQLASTDPAVSSRSAKRGEQTRSRAPTVIRVGTPISPSTALDVVRDGRLGLGQERVQRLGGAAAHEVHQRVHELRPVDVHLGREAPAGRCPG